MRLPVLSEADDTTYAHCCLSFTLPIAVTFACVFYFLVKRLEFPGTTLKAAPTNDPKMVGENTLAQKRVQRCFNHSDASVPSFLAPSCLSASFCTEIVFNVSFRSSLCCRMKPGHWAANSAMG